jgi:tetratricopeptide (TPR) repeat protein
MKKILIYLVFSTLFSCGSSSEELLEKGRNLMKEQRFEEAIQFLNKAIEKDSKNTEAFNARGVALFELGKYNDAMLDYSQAIQLTPNNYKPYFNRAELKKALKQMPEALKDYNEAIKLSPKTADLYLNRGVLQYQLNNLDQAIQDFKQACVLNPTDKNAFYNLGNIFFEKGDHASLQEAEINFKKVIDLDKKHVKAYLNLGQVLIGLNQPEQACKNLEEAEKLGNTEAKELKSTICK